MKICAVSDFFVPQYFGGGEVRLHQVLKRLAEKGHKVDVLTFRVKGVPDKEQFDGINVHHIGPVIDSPPNRKVSQLIRFMLSVFFWLSRHKYDAVDVQPFGSFIPAYICHLLRLQKNIVATIHDVSHTKDKSQWIQHSRLALFVERRVYRLPFRKIITVSNVVRQALIKEYGVKEKRLNVVFNGADVGLIDSIKRQKQDNSIIYIGRLIPHKHIDDLLLSFKEVHKENSGIKLKIIGEGQEKGSLIKMSKKLGISQRVRFLGRLADYKDVIAEIKKSLFLVLPSTREGFGMVLAEANACRKPVVAYASGGVLDVVMDGKNGFLVEPRNVKDLSKMMNALAKDKKLREKMGIVGRTLVEQHFTWDKAAEEIEKVYKV
ncbi:MAG TPA: glycosyltransferase family 1 protein [Candidatus Woesearchaeota archaeon]|nr:glycosyltransferase family 1 protein [Candidatus Woesearchaeota archaeon]